MPPFSADAIVFSKKNIFFDLENMKNPPSKVAHNRPPTFLTYCLRLSRLGTR